MGTALLALYRVTGDAKWLDHAVSIADALLINLYDQENGGFYSAIPDETATIIAPRKPLELNAVAARQGGKVVYMQSRQMFHPYYETCRCSRVCRQVPGACIRLGVV